MFKLLINSRKGIEILLLVIILNIGGITIVNGNSLITADWGDVVDVKYSLWEDAEHTIEVPENIDQNLSYIYLSNGMTVPQDVLALFPEATAAIILKFKEAIIGMAKNETKDFKINSEDAYNDGDMYYRVILLSIQYDQSSVNTSTITTIPSSETTIITSTESQTTNFSTATTLNTTTKTKTIPELTAGSSALVSMLVLLLAVYIRKKGSHFRSKEKLFE